MVLVNKSESLKRINPLTIPCILCLFGTTGPIHLNLSPQPATRLKGSLCLAAPVRSHTTWLITHFFCRKSTILFVSVYFAANTLNVWTNEHCDANYRAWHTKIPLPYSLTLALWPKGAELEIPSMPCASTPFSIRLRPDFSAHNWNTLTCLPGRWAPTSTSRNCIVSCNRRRIGVCAPCEHCVIDVWTHAWAPLEPR